MRSFLNKLAFLITSFFFLFFILFYFLNPKKFEEVSRPQESSKILIQKVFGGSNFIVLKEPTLEQFKVYSKALEPRGGTVIRDPEEWQTYFEHLSGSYQKAPNVVDFSTKDLLIVSGGRKPTNGYSVRVESVVVGADIITVGVKEIEPGKNCKGGESVTTPADFVIIKKTYLPVEFNFVTQVKGCFD